MKNLFKNLKKYPLIIFFAVFLYALSIADLFSPQYETSELENRDLAKFPAFSLKALINNEYTPKIEDFTEDHFIVRNSWISLKSISESVLGKGENNGIVYGEDGYLFTKVLAADTTQRDKNVNAIGAFVANNPEFDIDVMLVPTAPSVMTDKVKPGSPVNDASVVINQLKNLVGDENLLDVTDVLKAHSDEYIYYRTDHHWTSLGAYYAYADFMTSNGLSPRSTDEFTFVEVENFLGTHYSKSKNFNVKPDVMTYIENDSEIEIMGTVSPIYDYSKLEVRDKYAMFLQGNNGFSTIKGDGEGKILVIKDSYANCFVPFLTGDFEQVDVIDLRFHSSSVRKLMLENEYDHVLVMYNSETIDTDIYVPKLNMYNQ
ncbi:MAG: hypothetical protein J6J58_07225 [Oscillospiraceae bacterium]|nr:hypothetical protein [Oscillospiraceae bacterium]